MISKKAIELFAVAIGFAAYNCEATSALLNMDLVMRANQTFYAIRDETNYPKYRGTNCTVRFPTDGNFGTQKGFDYGGWDSNHNASTCSVGYTYTLNYDGNLVTYCGTTPSYATLTNQLKWDGFFLAIDSSCILHLFDGKWDSNTVKVGQINAPGGQLTMRRELWTNVRTEFKNGDRLIKGDYVVYPDKNKLLLQSSDGNLVLYNGKTPLWAANNEWKSGPDSSMRDYYATTYDGQLLLVGVNFNNKVETVYFNKTLKDYTVNMKNCYTVIYNGNGNLTARSCSTLRNLRGRSAAE